MQDARVAAAAAVVIAVAFAVSTGERWSVRRARHDLAWTVSLLFFATGALALCAATAIGWRSWSFRLFYLCGGVLTVPTLALGTVYLLGGARRGDRVALVAGGLGAFAAGVVVTAPLRVPLVADTMNEGQVVFGLGPRLFAAVGSGVGALVVIGGALWSAWRALRTRPRAAELPQGATSLGAPSAGALAARGRGRLAAANLAIAAGTLLLSFKRPFVALTGSDASGFALALSSGLGIIFAGFLLASVRPARRASPGAGETRSGLGGGSAAQLPAEHLAG